MCVTCLNVLYKLLFCTENYRHTSNVQEVDIKDEVRPTDTDSYSNVCTSHSSKLSNCSDSASVDSSEPAVTSSVKTDERSHMCEKRHTCNVCNKQFVSSLQLGYHMRTHAAACSICRKKFAHTSALKRHVRSHADGLPFACDACSRRFADTSQLEAHMQCHTRNEPKTHTCDVCGMTFEHFCGLNYHMSTHRDERQFASDICHRRFKHPSVLKQHRRKLQSCNNVESKPTVPCRILPKPSPTVSEELPFACDVCHCRFADSVHLCFHKCDKGKTHTCGVCSMQFKHLCQLSDHIRTHRDHRPFACDICHRTFKYASRFKQHRHKLFPCNVCNMTLLHSADYKRHLRTHTDERRCQQLKSNSVESKPTEPCRILPKTSLTVPDEPPFLCDKCRCSFKWSFDFKSHVCTRTDEDKLHYVCYICQTGFKYASELEQHIHSHTSERTHTCNICSKAYTKLHYLQRHMRTHSIEWPHTCNMCRKTFTQSHYLERHICTHPGAHGPKVLKTTVGSKHPTRRHTLPRILPKPPLSVESNFSIPHCILPKPSISVPFLPLFISHCSPFVVAFSTPAELSSCDEHIYNIQEVDVKDEVSATNTNTVGNMCTPQNTSQLSSCNDHVSVDSSGHQFTSTDNYHQICNVQEVDIKDEVSAANTDSFSTMSNSTIQHSSYNDRVSVDRSGHQFTCSDSYHQISNVHKVDVKDEVSAASTVDSCGQQFTCTDSDVMRGTTESDIRVKNILTH